MPRGAFGMSGPPWKGVSAERSEEAEATESFPPMANDQQDVQEQNGNGTPSTASRIRQAPVENAFPTPTPPRRLGSRASESQQGGRESPGPTRLFKLGKSSPAPKEHKSVEALRSNVSRHDSTGLSSASELEKSWQGKEVSRKNSRFFDQAFAVREPYNSAKERVNRDSTILVELQCNCCFDHEQRFLNDLSMYISEIYHKPQQNIMITAITDAHIMIGGSTEPAYLITITALAGEIAAVKNMRATAMVQDFLSDSLKILPIRGILRFHAIKEEDLGTDSTTMRAAIEKIEAEEKRLGSLRSRQSNRASKKSALPSMSENYGHIEPSRSDTPILLPTDPGEDFEEKPQRNASSAGRMMRSRKSIMQFWKKTT